MLRLLYVCLTAVLAVLPAAALAASVLETAVVTAASPWIVGGLMIAAGGVVGWLAATSERFAAPARAKKVADRTLVDKGIIEIDRRIDQINIEVIRGFATRFVEARLPQVLQSPVLDPMRHAGAWVDEALIAFQHSNPEIADATGIGHRTLQEILAAAIGRAQKDVLTDALRQAGALALPAAPTVEGA